MFCGVPRPGPLSELAPGKHVDYMGASDFSIVLAYLAPLQQTTPSMWGVGGVLKFKKSLTLKKVKRNFQISPKSFRPVDTLPFAFLSVGIPPAKSPASPGRGPAEDPFVGES